MITSQAIITEKDRHISNLKDEINRLNEIIKEPEPAQDKVIDLSVELMQSIKESDKLISLKKILKVHSNFLRENPYCYFELAYTRPTQWMVWICSKSIDDDPNRVVHTKGQGHTPEEAAKEALENWKKKKIEELMKSSNENN